MNIMNLGKSSVFYIFDNDKRFSAETFLEKQPPASVWDAFCTTWADEYVDFFTRLYWIMDRSFKTKNSEVSLRPLVSFARTPV